MKESSIPFKIWLTALAVLLTGFSLFHDHIVLWGAGKTTGLLIFGMLDLLCLLALICGERALKRLLIFAAATLLYAVYCFGLQAAVPSNSTRDALVAGGFLCAAYRIFLQINS